MSQPTRRLIPKTIPVTFTLDMGWVENRLAFFLLLLLFLNVMPGYLYCLLLVIMCILGYAMSETRASEYVYTGLGLMAAVVSLLVATSPL